MVIDRKAAQVCASERAEFPPGVFNVVTGDAELIGNTINECPDVRLITFTGSTEVGKLSMRNASQTLKKVSLELGGNAPFIVFEDANLDAAVDGLIASKFRSMGQTCVCPNRIFVHRSVHDRFLKKLLDSMRKLKLGDGMALETNQGPLINLSAVQKIERHITDAIACGAVLQCGGKKHALGGTYFEPTVISDVTSGMIISQEETFGPVVPISKFSSDEEVVSIANSTRSGLAGYFYTRDLARALRVSEALEVGMVGINTAAISVVVAPFGGVKESGIGREGSHHGILEFTELKYTMIGGIDRPPRHPWFREPAPTRLQSPPETCGN